MTKRKGPNKLLRLNSPKHGYLERTKTLTQILYEEKIKEPKPKAAKIKKIKFAPCQECKQYAPLEVDEVKLFRCLVKGKCIHL